MELVEIVSMQNDSEAIVVKSLLESHGVHVVMRSPLVQSVHPITVDGVGRVKILVPQEQEQKAREIIDEKGLPRPITE